MQETGSNVDALFHSVSTATGAGPHQPLHLQPAGVHGRARAGEHAEALWPRHFHEDTEGRQWHEQRSRLRQVPTTEAHTRDTHMIPVVTFHEVNHL